MALKPEEIENRFSLIEKEIKVSGEDLDRIKVGVLPDIEALRIDIEAFKRLLKSKRPELFEEYMRMRDEVSKELEPPEKAA